MIPSQQRMVALTMLLLLALAELGWSFLAVASPRQQDRIKIGDKSPALFAGSNPDRFDMDVLHDRLVQMQVDVLETEMEQPPNPQFSPKEFCKHLLHALWDNSNPLPDSGFRVLLRSSTPRWRRSLYHSVAAPNSAKEEAVASALGEAIARPNNQFAILVEDFVADTDSSFEPPYTIEFPTDVVDYCDGTCWVECRLRSKTDGSLLVVMGWQLQRRSLDRAWLVDQIDWQDFREQFRPGIGREEWMRICG